jgi:hypothetical protein
VVGPAGFTGAARRDRVSPDPLDSALIPLTSAVRDEARRCRCSSAERTADIGNAVRPAHLLPRGRTSGRHAIEDIEHVMTTDGES